MKTRRDDLHVLTGSYALDALEDPERERFEHHLRHCASCAAEVRGLRETAARLAMAQALQPPAQMAEQVLAATYRTRQLPPLPARPGRGRRPARLARLDGRRAAGHRRMPWLAAAAAAAAVAAAVALGITQAATEHRLDSARSGMAAITRVITAPDARIQTTRATAGGTVTVVVSAARRAAVVTTRDMPPLASARVYQVWVMSPSGARSAGLLAGTAPVLAASVRPGDRIGITVEPSGGTSHPTTTPVVIVPLTA